MPDYVSIIQRVALLLRFLLPLAAEASSGTFLSLDSFAQEGDPAFLPLLQQGMLGMGSVSACAKGLPFRAQCISLPTCGSWRSRQAWELNMIKALSYLSKENSYESILTYLDNILKASNISISMHLSSEGTLKSGLWTTKAILEILSPVCKSKHVKSIATQNTSEHI